MRSLNETVVDACFAGCARLARDIVFDLGAREVGEPCLVRRFRHVNFVHGMPRLQSWPLTLVLIRVLVPLVWTQLPLGLHRHLLPVDIFEALVVWVRIVLG